MIKNNKKLWEMLVGRARELAPNCEKVFMAGSGGIDSSLLAVILCDAFGPENVVVLFRDIRSNPDHLQDVKDLQKNLGFKLVFLDLNNIYDMLLDQIREQFVDLGLSWENENSINAEVSGFENAYVSLKSRMTTPIAGFISKAVDGGRGRIFGTGNGEEDGLLRYFDKFGDGAVDNNILNGLTKAEVRQLAIFSGRVPMKIVKKIPSADLKANGNDHNDENELSSWAKKLGYEIQVSYGASDGSSEGNIAWAWKQNMKYGVITGETSGLKDELYLAPYDYSEEQVQIIYFLRAVEKMTRHKIDPAPGLDRQILLNNKVVD